MTIEEAHIAKGALEHNIMNALREFEDDSGLTITDVRYTVIHGLGGQKDKGVNVTVTVRL